LANITLRLYITGHSPRSQIAVQNLQSICQSLYQGECEIEIVDVLTDPEKAETDHILATPTLIKISPPPERRVIGDLSDFKKAIAALGLASDETQKP